MKILRKGSVIFRGTCDECRTIVECEPNEVQKRHSGTEFINTYVTCPVCDSEIKVYTRNFYIHRDRPWGYKPLEENQ
jgi:RNase P subunit RPR2